MLFIPNNIKIIRTDFNYRLFYIMYIIFKCFILHEYNKYNNSYKVILKYFLYVPVLYLRARLYCFLLFFHAMSIYFLLQFFLSTMASRLRLTGLLHPFHELRVFFSQVLLTLLTSAPSFAPILPLFGFSNFHRRRLDARLPLFIRVLARVIRLLTKCFFSLKTCDIQYSTRTEQSASGSAVRF